jgi:hypothetical protein
MEGEGGMLGGEIRHDDEGCFGVCIVRC